MPSTVDPEIKERADKLLLEAGYKVDGYPEQQPKTFFGYAARAYTKLVAIGAAFGLGMVLNLLLSFSAAFVIADDPSEWVSIYMGNDGYYFVGVTLVISAFILPRIWNLKLTRSR